MASRNTNRNDPNKLNEVHSDSNEEHPETSDHHSDESAASSLSKEASPLSNKSRRKSVSVDQLFQSVSSTSANPQEEERKRTVQDDPEAAIEVTEPNQAENSEQLINKMSKPAKLTAEDMAKLSKKHEKITSTFFELREQAKLTSANYETWKEAFDARMRNAALEPLIRRDWEPAVTATAEWQELDQLAKDNILNNINSDMASFVRGESSAKGMYDKIVLHNEGNTVMRGWRLCKKLKELMSNNTDDLDVLAMNYSRVVDSLRTLFTGIPDDFYASLYSAILPAKFDYLLSDVHRTGSTLDYKEIVNLTLAAHTRMKESAPEQMRVISNIAAYTKQPVEMDDAGQSKPKKGKKKKEKPPRHCDYCGKDNHDQDYCLIRSRDIISGKAKLEPATVAVDPKVKDDQPGKPSKSGLPIPHYELKAFVANFGDKEQEELDPDAVYVDTCAGATVSNKVEGCIGELRKMDAVIRDWESRESKIHGVGDYLMQTETGFTIKISDVIYKSTASATFVSYAKLMATGKFKIIGEDDWIEFRDKATDKLVMTARRVSANIMKLDIKPHPATLNPEFRVCRVTINHKMPTEFMYRFWHNNLGHPLFGYLQKQRTLLDLNSTILERLVDAIARALLKQAILSVLFWPCAIMYAVWLKNRFPHTALDFDSPFYELVGKRPELHKTKQFGSLWFASNLQATAKFTDAARPAIFLGYPNGTKGADLYLIDERRVDISAHLHPSEKVAGGRVQTGSTYKIDESDNDVFMESDSVHFARPLYGEERGTVQDHMNEMLEHSVIQEEDLADYSTCPSNLSIEGYDSAQSVLNHTALVLDDDLSISTSSVSEQSSNVPITEQPAQSGNTAINEPQAISNSGKENQGERDHQQSAERSAPDSQTTAKPPLEAPRLLADVIDTSRTDHEDYPRGRIIMNKGESAWFKTTFPESRFLSSVPCKGPAAGNSKQRIVNVAALSAPHSYEQAIKGPCRNIFQSFKLAERLPDAQVLPTIWLYQYDSLGQTIGDKARLVIRGDKSMLNEFKKKLAKRIKVKDHGEIKNFLNVQYKYDRLNRTMEIDQSKYIRSILKDAEFEECRPSPIPIRQADVKKLQLSEEERKGDPDFKSCLPVDREWYQVTLGKNLYVANCSRFDFALAVSILCSHMHDPQFINLKMLKHFLRYLQHSKDKKLVYRSTNNTLASNSEIVIYADSSFEEEVSRMGLLSFVCGNLVGWTSRKQNRVATSTSESEILAVHDAINEVEYLHLFIDELGFAELLQHPTTILNDNLSAKASFYSGGKFDRNKHYKNRLNRVIRAIEEELASVEYVETSKMLADMLTKPLSGEKITQLTSLIGLQII